MGGSMLGLGLAVNGTTSNLLVYLLKEYNVESIDAAQITNMVRGSLNLVPVAGAVLADSYLGSFPVILAGAAINLLASIQVGTHGDVQYNVGDRAVVESGSDGAPSKNLRFLNRAAMITSASDNSGGASGPSVWRLCTVQQVEDLKSLLGVFPLWSSGIMALAMDRSLGPHFNIPAGAISVCSLVAFIVATPVLDRAVFPLWHKITDTPASPLQRVGLGHVVNIAGMVAAALVERRRLSGMRAHPGGTPMSVLWLLLPLGVVGAGEALHFPGNMAFYYMEFPKTLRSLATAMAPLLIAMGFYISTVFVDIVRRVTAWLPENIDQGRLDNVYWTLAVAATLNFGYFLVCVWRYKYHIRGTRVAM
uniref:Peptide transporter PTR1 n=1 Tax=Aegilops tauschii TaxID=37682 RepID=M8B1L8_AEGTA